MGVFSAMNLFAEQANMDHEDIFGWIFSPSLKNKLITLLHNIDNEFSRPDSFANYLKDLGLVNKSFLSYTANPGLSSFFAITGAYAGMPRCLNATMSQHGSSKEALFNAKVAGYVIRTKGAIVAPLVISTSTPYDYSDQKGSAVFLNVVSTERFYYKFSCDPETFLVRLSYAILGLRDFCRERVVRKTDRVHRRWTQCKLLEAFADMDIDIAVYLQMRPFEVRAKQRSRKRGGGRPFGPQSYGRYGWSVGYVRRSWTGRGACRPKLHTGSHSSRLR
ncbi:Hypothetical predicted protein [Cloeon dipterum]|uniref:Rhabdovirus nucleocapsid domain-containing protein n=1 Tax=Cloeon dipterum TaxID=197152 RepID=A0A8S1E0T2_9INSE|nr:Hypothetical predicted protein [Cloeon dipterum]